jgi:hypothetical protein
MGHLFAIAYANESSGLILLDVVNQRLFGIGLRDFWWMKVPGGIATAPRTLKNLSWSLPTAISRATWEPVSCSRKRQIHASGAIECSPGHRALHPLKTRTSNVCSESSAIGTALRLARLSVPITSATARSLTPCRPRRIRQTRQRFGSVTWPWGMTPWLPALLGQ